MMGLVRLDEAWKQRQAIGRVVRRSDRRETASRPELDPDPAGGLGSPIIMSLSDQPSKLVSYLLAMGTHIRYPEKHEKPT